MITAYAKQPNGGRRRMFSVGDFTVYVDPNEDDAAAEAFTRRLFDAARGKKPASGVRLFGPGCVRMDDGAIWLLGSREKGWAAFGFRFESWDDLFRRYGVIVTSHGVDEVGPYWIVENAPVRP